MVVVVGMCGQTRQLHENWREAASTRETQFIRFASPHRPLRTRPLDVGL